MVGRVKGLVKSAARRAMLLVRKTLMRFLRPVLMRIDTHLQWLFDRQQDDRVRLARLEQQVIALEQQLATVQARQTAARRSYAA